MVILTVVVLLFGHRRLPELGHALGKGMGAFKQGLEGKGMENLDLPSQPSPFNDSDPNHKMLK